MRFGGRNLLLYEKTNGIWFHGTSFSCCESICKQGIDFEGAKHNQDFSNGMDFIFHKVLRKIY